MQAEYTEIVTDGDPVVVLVEAQEPVLWRTSFEFFGGLLMFVLFTFVVIALVAILAVAGVIVAIGVLGYEMYQGWKLDREIARRLP